MAIKVRYVSSESGIQVRETAAGSAFFALAYGELMYDMPGIPNLTASLNGESLVWAKVHFFPPLESEVPDEGWVAIKYTTEISTTVPTKSMVCNSDSYLKQHERLINARYIHNYLQNKGWGNNAIFAMLGNMEEESTINPGKWQYSKQGDRIAYGLTQWTPPTKYTGWLSSGADKSDIDNQLKRILYEVSNDEEQWNKQKHSPVMTFSEFTTSQKSVSALTEYFLKCYEQPTDDGSTELAERQANALKWSTLIRYLL